MGLTTDKVERIFVCGPYSSRDRKTVRANIDVAVFAAKVCMLRGHDAHCPHAATDPVELISDGAVPYERWMRLNLGVVHHWATALLYLGSSPGADRELAVAEKLGLKIYRGVDEVPTVEEAA